MVRRTTWCTRPPLVAAALVLIALPEARPGFSVPDDHHIVHVEATLGLALTDHAQTAVNQRPRVNLPRDRPPIVYFYSRGGRQITNRGAEVFHQLHHAVRREGIMSFLEDGVDKYATSDSQYIEDYDEISQILGPHDNVVVTAIPHAMDESIGALLPPYTGVPFLGNRTRVIKWQIGIILQSAALQHLLCDTYTRALNFHSFCRLLFSVALLFCRRAAAHDMRYLLPHGRYGLRQGGVHTSPPPPALLRCLGSCRAGGARASGGGGGAGQTVRGWEGRESECWL